MSWWYMYGFFAGVCSMIGCQINILVGVLLTVVFGLSGWIYEITTKTENSKGAKK